MCGNGTRVARFGGTSRKDECVNADTQPFLPVRIGAVNSLIEREL
jgi:hypothetical protein